MKIFSYCATVLALIACVSSVHADMVPLFASKDTTIFQNNPNNSDGGGQGLFVGTNGTSSPRRALIAFDVSGIPSNAVVQSVQLTLWLGQNAGGGSGSFTIDLFRLTKNWIEGTNGSSSTTISNEGQGFASPGGDATWNAAQNGSVNWTTAGGDFAASASASQTVSALVNTSFAWGSTAALVSDVQGWISNPATNFGWLLKNQDETSQQTFRAFFSRTSINDTFRPQLTVTYAVPEPASFFLTALGLLGLAGLRKITRKLP